MVKQIKATPKAKSAQALNKINIKKARRIGKIPASISRKKSIAMKKALSKSERIKLIKEAWKTRRKLYGQKGYKNKPGVKK